MPSGSKFEPESIVMFDASTIRALQDQTGERISSDEGWQSRSNADTATANIFLEQVIARTDAKIAECFSAQTYGNKSRSPNEIADDVADNARLLLRDLCELWREVAFETTSFHPHAGTALFPGVSDLDEWLSALNTRMQMTGLR